MIKRSNDNIAIQWIPEEAYYVGKDRKDTVDWIVFDDTAALFVECKTKRVAMPAKVELDDIAIIQDELNKMAQFIVQVYKTIVDYRHNHYPSFNYKEGMQIYPLVVTLEDWYLFSMQSKLRDMVQKMLIEIGLSDTLIVENPYTVCSVEEFEELIQLVQETSIDKPMKEKSFDKQKRDWNLGTFIRNDYNSNILNMKFLFTDDYEHLFNQFIRELGNSGDTILNL